MDFIIIALLIISILLLVFSFFKKDRITELEKNIEEVSIKHIQDLYQLKKKISVLEEELLIQETRSGPITKKKVTEDNKNPSKISKILNNQVLSLYQQGLSIEEIAQRSTLSQGEIFTLLQNSKSRGSE